MKFTAFIDLRRRDGDNLRGTSFTFSRRASSDTHRAMSDRTAIDSPTFLPLQAPGLEAASRSDAEAPSLAKAASAKKARRPQPTFDDGALTRTFKFPSKAFPRSSYYVTSTEIIIRIKKARRKWKLIVPKRRVVSYRTNRWFAKPRWVAIELTYTQAVKLGLAEARARMPNAMPEIVASNAASFAQSETAYPDTTCAAPSPAGPETLGGANEFRNDLTNKIDVLDEPNSADDFRLATDQDESEADEQLPQKPPLASHEETTPPNAADTMRIDEDDSRVVLIVARRQQTMAARRTFRRAIATLAAAITGFAIWAAFDAASLNPNLECARAELAAHCAQPIVTGSIGSSSEPQLSASAPIEGPALSAAQVATITPADLAARNIAASAPLQVAEEKRDTALLANATNDARAIVLSRQDIALPPSPPVFTSTVPTPQPTATAPAECDSLSATDRHILINFDYASSHLDAAVLAVLEDFAAMLRACPGSKVTIEGHTDSDGRAGRNRALSLRRAQVVQKHLVVAGLDPHRLATIGFGQTRPTVPNVSEKNKRTNRRVVLVVTTQR
jgi:outer membrane protein OmpA-like peptidoglycan-associated protein